MDIRWVDYGNTRSTRVLNYIENITMIETREGKK